MTGLFSANAVVILKHVFGNIFVTDCRLLVVDSLCLECFVKSHVGHNCCNYSISVQFSLGFQEFTTYIQDLIAIDDVSLMVYRDTAVSISVICKTDIQSVVYYILLQDFDMCGTTCSVDVGSIRFIVDDISLCTKCIKNALCDRRGASV